MAFLVATRSIVEFIPSFTPDFGTDRPCAADLRSPARPARPNVNNEVDLEAATHVTFE